LGDQGLLPEVVIGAEVEVLMDLLFDEGIVQNYIVEIGYDQERIPLGKLSSEMIKKGYGILEKLLPEIVKPAKEKNRRLMDTLTSEFFSYIPHNIGWQKTYYHKITDQEDLDEKVKMLQVLESIKIQTKLNHNNCQTPSERNLKNYSSLGTQITHLPKNTPTYTL
jgi:poly [ADP-ribose] polymerase